MTSRFLTRVTVMAAEIRSSRSGASHPRLLSLRSVFGSCGKGLFTIGLVTYHKWRNVTKVTKRRKVAVRARQFVACVTKFLEQRVALSLALPLDGSLQRSNCPDLPQLSGSRRVVVSPSSKIL